MEELMYRLEHALAKLYDGMPSLPESVTHWLTKWMAWGSLLAGFLSLWNIWTLWELSHHSITRPQQLGAVLWLPLLVLMAEALLYLLAVPGLYRRQLSGWRYLYSTALLSLLYGLLIALTNYGSFGTMIVSLVSSALSLYLLYQIRGNYHDHPDSTGDKKA